MFKSLCCRRSYALGVPFRYGLAAALFALAAVLFADWDRSRGVGGRRSPLMDTVQPVSFLCSVDLKRQLKAVSPPLVCSKLHHLS